MKHILLVLMLFTALCANSQSSKREAQIVGKVYNVITGMKISNTKVTLMSEDSIPIHTNYVVDKWMDNSSNSTFYKISIPTQLGKYIIKLENEDYKTCYLNYEMSTLPKLEFLEGPDAKMQPIHKKGLHGDNELGEVVVKATKVQFFYKGDTIVYNADAFNLPEGSMLDALIRQMPGARLTEDGQIFINGRKIDYLTLNGKRMFDGNGQVIMQNLPYYSVKDLKVFEQNQEHQIGTNMESTVKDYVMNVTLKRIYDKRNFGNVELGMGTKERKLARLFDAYSRESLMLMGYANLNNINQTRDPGHDGSFSDMDGPRSIVDNKQVGLSINQEKGNLANTLTMTGAIKKTSTAYLRSQTTRMSQQNVYNNKSEQQNDKLSSFKANNRLVLRKPFFLRSITDIYYDDGRNNQNSEQRTFELQDEQEFIANNSKWWQNAKHHKLNLSQQTMLYKPTSNGDEMGIKVNVEYNEGRNKSKESQTIIYPRMNVDSVYQYLANENVWNKEYSFGGNAIYKFNFTNGFGLQLDFVFLQDYTSKERLRYKNERLDNSFHSNTVHRENQPGIIFSYQSKKLTLTSGMRVKIVNERLNYQREEIDTLFHKNYVDVYPDFSVRWQSDKSTLEFYNKYNSYQKPAVLDLVEKIDDSNPLLVTKGNRNLKKVSMYDYQFLYTYHGTKKDLVISFDSQSQFMFNSICRAMSYNESTGSYLMTPYNIGTPTWYLMNRFSFGMTLNKSKTLRLENNLTYRPTQQVSLTGISQTELKKNKYNINTVEEGLILAYQYKKATWRLEGSLKYQGSRCSTDADINYDAWDIHYGMNVNCYLPLKIQFAGDIGMYSRTGYSLDALNKSSLISNISLSRAFYKNKLLVKAKVFDIFHELTSVDRWATPSRIEEADYNCIPRYGMLSVIYRFGKS